MVARKVTAAAIRFRIKQQSTLSAPTVVALLAGHVGDSRSLVRRTKIPPSESRHSTRAPTQRSREGTPIEPDPSIEFDWRNRRNGMIDNSITGSYRFKGYPEPAK